MQEHEIWRPVYFSDMYEVSNLGRVRSWRINGRWGEGRRAAEPRLMKPNPQKYGHLCCGFRVDGRTKHEFVHRLVAFAFLGEPPETGRRVLVRHMDGDPSNNRVSNLRWGTHWDNHADRVKGRAPRDFCVSVSAFELAELEALATELRGQRGAGVLDVLLGKIERGRARSLDLAA